MYNESHLTLEELGLPCPPGALSCGARPLDLQKLEGSPVVAPVGRSRRADNQTYKLSINFGRVRINRRQVAELCPGVIISLENAASEPVDITAGRQVIGQGEPIVVDGKLAVRVLELY